MWVHFRCCLLSLSLSSAVVLFFSPSYLLLLFIFQIDIILYSLLIVCCSGILLATISFRAFPLKNIYSFQFHFLLLLFSPFLISLLFYIPRIILSSFFLNSFLILFCFFVVTLIMTRFISFVHQKEQAFFNLFLVMMILFLRLDGCNRIVSRSTMCGRREAQRWNR